MGPRHEGIGGRGARAKLLAFVLGIKGWQGKDMVIGPSQEGLGGDLGRRKTDGKVDKGEATQVSGGKKLLHCAAVEGRCLQFRCW